MMGLFWEEKNNKKLDNVSLQNIHTSFYFCVHSDFHHFLLLLCDWLSSFFAIRRLYKVLTNSSQNRCCFAFWTFSKMAEHQQCGFACSSGCICLNWLHPKWPSLIWINVCAGLVGKTFNKITQIPDKQRQHSLFITAICITPANTVSFLFSVERRLTVLLFLSWVVDFSGQPRTRPWRLGPSWTFFLFH